MNRSIFLLATLGIAITSSAVAGAALIDFPTPNRAILAGKPEAFYMHVTRNFEGRTTTPWEGGMYGFVRGPVRADKQVQYLKHHEGIDIAPLHRDPAGNPLDPILAVADGRVAYVNNLAKGSNYGKYVVIEHRIDGSNFYSLYAHLGSVSVQAGDPIRQGDKLGVMGYTGVGLDRARAHLHFEFAMMVSPHFAEWFPATGVKDPNPHGNLNGRNLLGVDPMALLLAARSAPETFRLGDHLRSEPESFRVIVPASPDFTLIERNSWLLKPGAPTRGNSWLIAFSENGTPVRAAASDRTVSAPEIVSVTPKPGLTISRTTRGLVTGNTANPRFTSSGTQLMRLLTERPPIANSPL